MLTCYSDKLEKAVSDAAIMISTLTFIYGVSNDQYTNIKETPKYSDEELNSLKFYFSEQIKLKSLPKNLCDAINGITEVTSLNTLCTDIAKIQTQLSNYDTELTPNSHNLPQDEWFTNFINEPQQKLKNKISSNFNLLVKFSDDNNLHAFGLILDLCKDIDLENVIIKINNTVITDQQFINFVFDKYNNTQVVSDMFKFVLSESTKVIQSAFACGITKNKVTSLIDASK